MIRLEDRPNPLGQRIRRLTGHLGATARRSGLGRLAVAARLAGVWRRTGIRPGEALALGLGDPAVSDETLSACLSKVEMVALQDALNPTELTCLTEDKSVFYPLCQALRIPVPATLAIVSPAGGWVAGGSPLSDREAWARHFADAFPATFVSKPARGAYGDAVTVWTRVEGGFSDHRGRLHTAAELHHALVSHPTHRCFVVQERLENHEELRRLTGSAYLQTVRAATLVEPDGRPRLLYAELKLITGSNVIDNYMEGRTGNLCANVARDSGLLAPARRPSPDGVGFVVVPNHPGTGLPLEGVRLPGWPELVELVLRCALLFLPLRTIGWDVALTPGGPVIVEGNRWWDPPNDSVLAPAAPGVEQHEMVAGADLLRRYGRPAAGPGSGGRG
jgi:hypothetical protein